MIIVALHIRGLLGFVGLYLTCWILFTSCQTTKDQKRFQLLSAAETGIDFENTVAHRPDQNIIEYLYHYNGGGVAVGDVNNDGLEDIYLSANQSADQLYLNRGQLQFENVSASAGIVNTAGWSTGVTMTDVNQDGWLDIYVCQVGGYKSYQGQNKLFINNQDGTFSEKAEAYGLAFTGFFTQAAFLDYDGDGDNDVFLLNHAVHTPRSYRPVDQYLPRDYAAGDYLLRNDLNELGQFTDVTEVAGIKAYVRGYGLGLAISDINDDGWADIYVGNDFHENDYLYINNQDGTFTDRLTEMIPHTSQFTMGVDVQDINRDGLVDIFGTDMMPMDRSIRMKSGGEDPYKLKEAKISFGFHPQIARNTLQLNKGTESFADIGSMTGLFATDWSWSVLLEDLDNDGMTDVFISNGIYKRPNDLDYINYLSNYNLSRYSATQQDSIEQLLIEKMPTLKISNRMFKQNVQWAFEDVSEEWGLNEKGYSGATAVADFDLDGDLDLIVNNLNQPAWLFENQTSKDTTSHYLSIRLKSSSGRTYLGSKVTLFANGSQWTKQLNPTRGFQSSSTHLMHFGLGQQTKLDSIIFSNGERSYTAYNVEADQEIKLSMAELSEMQDSPIKEKARLGWQTTGVNIPKNTYLDYNNEPLIPYRLSLSSQAYAVADFNHDGAVEVFVGGSSGLSAAIYQLHDNKTLSKGGSVEVFELDAFFEDAACAVADFDGDGHLDIYVASGGNRQPEGSRWLQDRLYLGDGKLGFTRAEIRLPNTNASVATATDMDGDGDMDLFVGTRNVPGAYGFSSPSFFLENQGKGDLKVVQAIDMGMITDAEWFLDSDTETAKLVTVGEWEPIRFWSSQKGRWAIDESSTALDSIKGWFRSVNTADFNRDSVPDFIVGNIGLNITFTASQEHPTRLYLDDFDENGQSDPIVSHYLDGKEIPLANKDMLIGQLPVLKKVYASYEKYAAVNSVSELLGDLYVESSVIIKEATEFQHLALISTEKGYQLSVLPKEIQTSPLNDIVIEDFDGDGELDLLTAGNLLDHFSMLGQLDGNALSLALGRPTDTSFVFEHDSFFTRGTRQMQHLGSVGNSRWIAIPLYGEVLLASPQN